MSKALKLSCADDTRIFQTRRRIDHAGVSGTGIVAHGVEFDDGLVLLRWHGAITSIAFYRSMQMLEKVHGGGGDTVVEYLEPGDDPEDHYDDIGEIILVHKSLPRWFKNWV